jgi:ZIP family zinc transporter
MILFFSLLLHNFPEGLAVAASALESDKLGMTVTIGWSKKCSSPNCVSNSYARHNLHPVFASIGIMIHNIPEGIAIAIPCLKARPNSPFLSFILASVSGLAEPAGAFVSLVFLRGVEQRQVDRGATKGDEIGGDGCLENVLAFVAGIMITVSFLELFPEAKRHAEQSGMKAYYAGLCLGFIVMIATEFGMSL